MLKYRPMNNDEKILTGVFLACGNIDIINDDTPISQTHAKEICKSLFFLADIDQRFSQTTKRKNDWFEVIQPVSDDGRKKFIRITALGYEILKKILPNYYNDIIATWMSRSGDIDQLVGISNQLKELENIKLSSLKRQIEQNQLDFLQAVYKFSSNLLGRMTSRFGQMEVEI